MRTALTQRPELQQTRINLESTLISLKGSRNALLPTLQAFADFTNNALTGDPNALSNGANGTPDPYVVGGYSNLLGQIFRRNYPNYTVGFSLNIAFRNRAAQADYVADQLNLRQAELQLQRFVNQVRVDVKNAVISLQQARARYETAVATRVLAQQTLDAVVAIPGVVTAAVCQAVAGRGYRQPEYPPEHPPKDSSPKDSPKDPKDESVR